MEKVLIVDADPAFRETLAEHLGNQGLAAEVCGSVAEVPALLGEGTALVVAGECLPDGDAGMVVEASRRMGVPPPVLVVAAGTPTFSVLRKVRKWKAAGVAGRGAGPRPVAERVVRMLRERGAGAAPSPGAGDHGGRPVAGGAVREGAPRAPAGMLRGGILEVARVQRLQRLATPFGVNVSATPGAVAGPARPTLPTGAPASTAVAARGAPERGSDVPNPPGTGDLPPGEREFRQGLALLSMKEYRAAARHFEEARQERADDARFLAYRAWADYLAARDDLGKGEGEGTASRLKTVEEELLLATQLTTRHSDPERLLGSFLLDRGRFEDARRHFSAALRIDPKDAEARRGREQAEARLGWTRDAGSGGDGRGPLSRFFRRD